MPRDVGRGVLRVSASARTLGGRVGRAHIGGLAMCKSCDKSTNRVRWLALNGQRGRE
jgi:hypothetical protein